jgi:hypothetical protein
MVIMWRRHAAFPSTIILIVLGTLPLLLGFIGEEDLLYSRAHQSQPQRLFFFYFQISKVTLSLYVGLDFFLLFNCCCVVGSASPSYWSICKDRDKMPPPGPVFPNTHIAPRAHHSRVIVFDISVANNSCSLRIYGLIWRP